MTIFVAAVVEGHGEVTALPVLIRRIAAGVDVYDLQVRKPHRIRRTEMQAVTVRNAVRVQRAAVGREGVIVVVYDSDDDDPKDAVVATRAQLGEESALVCVAVREFEAWFLAGLESLRESPSVLDNAQFSGDPELKRGARKALEENMTESYKETIHQAKFASQLDLVAAAHRSPHFAEFKAQLEHELMGHPGSRHPGTTGRT